MNEDRGVNHMLAGFSPDACVLIAWIYEHHGIAVTAEAMALAKKALEQAKEEQA